MKAKDSLDAVLSRCAAKNGLSFRQIVTCEDLIKGLIARHYTDIPRSVNGLVYKITSFSQSVMARDTEQIKIYKQKSKLSIVFDEWTSGSHKRFMNIVLLGTNKFWNLGLVRINGSATSAKLLKLVKTHLKLFDIDFDNDICSIITDGCRVMQSIGKEIKPVLQQLCFAHAIQLAVVNVLYSATNVDRISVNIDKEMYASDGEDENDDRERDVESAVSDGEDESDDECGTIDFEKEEEALLHSSYSSLIQSVRSTVSIFRKSPLKDETLQKYSLLEFKKEYKLTLDCKTRWNSMCAMLERFYMMRKCISNALNELDIEVQVEKGDFVRIKELVDVLSPIKATVELLCRRDCNLIKADAAFCALLDHLYSQQTDVAISFYSSLVAELKKRRTMVTDVLKYLHSGKMHSEIHNHLDKQVPSKQQIAKFIDSVVKRWDKDDLLDFLEEEDEEFEETGESLAKKSKPGNDFFDSLNKVVGESMEAKANRSGSGANGSLAEIKTEMNLFEMSDSFQRGKNLELAYLSLLSITPTSVESERAFSLAGNFCTKIRSRLSDKNLSTLLYLRAYFQAEDEQNF